jgi:RND family efflux transporter MFP subunit
MISVLVTAVAALSLVFPAGMAGAADTGYTCLIEPFQRIELRSPVEARIYAMHVDRGSEVKKGQLLVELDSAAEKVALEAARYRAVMEGQVKTAESKLTGATEKFNRRDQLVAEKFISAQDRDDSLADMRVAEASLLEARDNRRLAAIEEQRLNEMLEQRRLRSPFNGVVTERLKHVGEMATTGENARPVLRLAQTHPLRVEVVLPVALYGQLKSGQRASVETEPPLSARYQATLTIVDRVVDSASGTFGVRLELPNPNGTIPAGVKCRVTFSR